MDLNGKVVFITGGARGIGAAVGMESARRGAKIALAGLEPDQLAETAAKCGPDAAHLDCDVTELESVRAAVEDTVEKFGRIDVVLANAGIATYGTVEKGDPEAWLRTIDINLNGVYRTMHATMPQLIETRGYMGVICSIASFAPLPGSSSYNASKAGAEHLVRAARAEVGFRGVDIGAIHPSWVDTAMVRDSERDLAAFRESRAKLPWPVKATTSVEDCANAIVDGFEQRAARVFVPKEAKLMYWLRNVINSKVGEKAMGREASKTVPKMEQEVAALGRAGSERTARINDLAGAEEKV